MYLSILCILSSLDIMSYVTKEQVTILYPFTVVQIAKQLLIGTNVTYLEVLFVTQLAGMECSMMDQQMNLSLINTMKYVIKATELTITLDAGTIAL